MNGDTVAAT